MKTKKKKNRNAFVIQAKQRKSSKIKARNKKRLNGKNKQRELLKDADNE